MAFLSIFKTIITSLVKKDSTIKYPLEPKLNHPNVRGHIEIEIDSCIFCGICQKRCPTDAITVSKADTTWEIKPFSCVQCCCCVEVCPKKCLKMDQRSTGASTTLTRDCVKKNA